MPRGELNNSPLRLVQNSSSVSADTLESLHFSQGLASQELQKDSIIGSAVRCNSMAFCPAHAEAETPILWPPHVKS